MKKCACGKAIPPSEWKTLLLVGYQDDGAGGCYELRNCTCSSTLCVHVGALAKPTGTRRAEVADAE